jgi:hypothetical protein
MMPASSADSRRDVDRVETRRDHQRVELPADERIAAARPLQLDLTLDRPR